MTDERERLASLPGEREREKMMEVLWMLPGDGSPIRWTPLEADARRRRMSLRTLRKYLARLQAADLAERIVDPATRPPGVYYRRRLPESFPGEVSRIFDLWGGLGEVRELLSRAGAPDREGAFLETLAPSHLKMLDALVLAILRVSLEGEGSRGYGLDEAEGLATGEEVAARLYGAVHGSADDMLDILIRPWIHGLIDVLMVHEGPNRIILRGLQAEYTREAMEAADRLETALAQLREEA